MARFNVKDYGATGDGSTDDTTSINNCYAAADDAPEGEMFFPAGSYKISSTLAWSKRVNVTGENGESTKLLKSGTNVGIEISSDGASAAYREFTLTSLNDSSINSSDTNSGIKMTVGNNIYFERVVVRRQGGHGFYLPGVSPYCMNGRYIACGAHYNGGSGFRLDGVSNVNSFLGCAANANNIGLDINASGNTANGNAVIAFTAEDNTGAGLHLGATAIQNNITIYLENNDDEALVCDAGSERNWITVLNLEASPTGKIIDNGTNNYFNAVGWGNYVSYPYMNRVPPGTNISGRNFNIKAGDAGVGATGHAGGNMKVAGGDAIGTSGAADGGELHLLGGEGINGGAGGVMYLQEYNTQAICIGSQSLSLTPTSVSIDFASTTRAPVLPRLTTTQQNALTGVNGMIIYNTTTNKVRAYVNGAWADL